VRQTKAQPFPCLSGWSETPMGSRYLDALEAAGRLSAVAVGQKEEPRRTDVLRGSHGVTFV
jgi:hypothetical protein